MYGLKVFSPRHNKVNSWVEIRQAMHGAAYVPFRGEGEDRRGEFILSEVSLLSSDNCSYKDRYVIGPCRYFACSCVKVLCFIFL